MARRVQEPVLSRAKEVQIGKRFSIFSLPLWGLVLTGLVSSGLIGLFPPFLRFLVVFALVSYLPGEVLRGRFLAGLGLPAAARVPVSVLTGLCVFALLSWLCWIAGAGFVLYIGLLQVFAFIFYGFFFVTDDKRTEMPRWSASDEPFARLKATLAAVAAVAVAVFFYLSPPQMGYGGDAYDHVGYIRTILVEDDIAPAGVLAPVDDDVLKADPRKGVMHPLLAAVCRLGDLDPAEMWPWLPVFLAPVAVLAFFVFASTLLPGIGYVLFCMMLFFMFQGGIGREFLGNVAYGQHLALVFFWLLFVLAVAYAKDPDNRLLSSILLLILAGSLIHFDVLIHFGLMWVSMLLFRRVFSMSFVSLLKIGIGAAVCTLVVLLWKLTSAYQGGNIIHTHPQGLLYFIDIGDAYFLPSPVEILRKNGLLFLVGMMLLPALLFVRGRHAWMITALSLPPIVIAMNPFVAPLVYEQGAYLLHRFLLNIPALAATSLVLGSLISWGRRGNLAKKALAFVIVFVWAKLFLLSAGAWMANAKSIRFTGPRPALDGAMASAVAYLNENSRPGSVVLSDPVTSYMLSAFSHLKVVAVLHQHGTPNDVDAVERLASVRVALSPFTTRIEALDVIAKYRVSYVLLNGSFRRPVHDFLADWDPAAIDIVETKIGGSKEMFNRVYDSDGIVILQVVGPAPESASWVPNATFFDGPPREWTACGPSDPDSPLRVTGVSFDPRVALAGERILATIGYERTGPIDSPLPLLLEIRLEDREYFDSANTYPGDKYVRRYRERRDAAFRRFRIVHRPFAGLYTPELWPVGRAVYETFQLQLPTDLSEKRYEIQLRLVHETLLPNFSIRDFFFNDDSKVGAACSEIEIRRQITR